MFLTELQAQLETCQSEQKTLLERYYVSSFDNEKLHETISDLRRKLEDSQSALHELGRENQTLQVNRVFIFLIIKMFSLMASPISYFYICVIFNVAQLKHIMI